MAAQPKIPAAMPNPDILLLKRQQRAATRAAEVVPGLVVLLALEWEPMALAWGPALG